MAVLRDRAVVVNGRRFDRGALNQLLAYAEDLLKFLRKAGNEEPSEADRR